MLPSPLTNVSVTIDYEYYLNQQVHPPLDRLCGPIEGTDATRLADCLGLDTSKFRSLVRSDTQDQELQTLGSQLSDAERYKDAEPLELRCRGCQATFACSSLMMEKVTTLELCCWHAEYLFVLLHFPKKKKKLRRCSFIIVLVNRMAQVILVSNVLPAMPLHSLPLPAYS
jgi:hypothetical protein